MAHDMASPSGWSTWSKCAAAPLYQYIVKRRIEAMKAYADYLFGDNKKEALDLLAEDEGASRLGTFSHSIFEKCVESRAKQSMASLEKMAKLINQADKVENRDQLKDFMNDMEFRGRLLDVINDTIEELKDCESFKLETRVQVRGIPHGGTYDLSYKKRRTLVLKDLKTGRVEVKAEGNGQTYIYAVGELDARGWDQFDEVVIGILGVRFKSSEFTIKVEDLWKFKQEQLIPKYLATTEINPEPTAGDHCENCDAKIVCSAFKAKASDTQELFRVKPLDTMTEAELKDIFVTAKSFDKMTKDVKKEINLLFQGFEDPELFKLQSTGSTTEYSVSKDEAEEVLIGLLGDDAKETVLRPAKSILEEVESSGDDELLEKVKEVIRVKPKAKAIKVK